MPTHEMIKNICIFHKISSICFKSEYINAFFFILFSKKVETLEKPINAWTFFGINEKLVLKYITRILEFGWIFLNFFSFFVNLLYKIKNNTSKVLFLLRQLYKCQLNFFCWVHYGANFIIRINISIQFK